MRNKIKGNKVAQMQISFGMIFSIILIVIFIAFAIYAIINFLDMAKFAKVEAFKNNLQEDIDKMWGSTEGSRDYPPYSLPREIEQVCFVDNDLENMYFVPNDFSGTIIKNIDFAKTLNGLDKLCISASGGKISIIISKSYDDKNGVTIAR